MQVAVLGVGFSPDGSLLATADGTGRVRIWSLGSRRVVRTIRVGAPLCGIAWSPDGKLIGAGQFGGYNFSTASAIRVWDVRSGRLVFRTTGTPATDHAAVLPGRPRPRRSDRQRHGRDLVARRKSPRHHAHRPLGPGGRGCLQPERQARRHGCYRPDRARLGCPHRQAAPRARRAYRHGRRGRVHTRQQETRHDGRGRHGAHLGRHRQGKPRLAHARRRPRRSRERELQQRREPPAHVRNV